MRAIVYEGKENVQVKNVQDPKIQKKDDIIVKVTSTAICGSDLHLLHGRIPNLEKGTVLGHETMGIIEEVGSEVVNLKKGYALDLMTKPTSNSEVMGEFINGQKMTVLQNLGNGWLEVKYRQHIGYVDGAYVKY